MKNGVIAGLLAGLGCVCAQGSAQAFGIDITFVGFKDAGIYGEAVVTLAPTAIAGQYLGVAISGGVTDDQLSPTTYTFTQMVAVGGYASNDNIMFIPPATSGGITSKGFTTFFGASNETTAGVDFNFAAQSATGSYVLVMNNSFQNPHGDRLVTGSDELTVTSASIVPELSTWAMLCLGFIGIGVAGAVSGRKRAAAV